MNKGTLTTAILGFIIIIFSWNCTKLDTTTLGSDLIPEVDNINTFSETLDIVSSQGFFTTEDTAKVFITDAHVLGRISNDPDFGTTDAEVYLQLKPDFFPYYFGGAQDTLVSLDSMVLCLSYKGYFGDSTTPQVLQVSALDPDIISPLWDSAYRAKPITFSPPMGEIVSDPKTIDIRDLKNVVRISKGQDSVSNQIRIKLNTSSPWVTSLFSQDSTRNGTNNAFYKDSLFRRRFKGLGIKALSGNALMYTSLTDENTRLEVHFKKRRANVVDTIYSSLAMNVFETNSSLPSVSANKITRDRSSGTYPPAGVPSDQIYLQTTPGTFALLTIPGLTDYPKRIIHRAEIIIEQIPGNPVTDSFFTAPNFVYVDLKDSGSANNFKPVYEDLNPNLFYNPDFTSGAFVPFYPSQVDFGYYGGFIRRKTDTLTGRNIAHYHINLTRSVQRISKGEIPNYQLRLFAPYSFVYPQYSSAIINYNNPLAFGRVKVGGGSNPDYKMRMVIIYSKL